MGKPKRNSYASKSGRAGRSGRSRSRERGRKAGADAKRREEAVRRDRDRAKLLARYEDVEPDGRILCMYGSHADTEWVDGQIRMCLLAPKVHKLFGLCVGDRVWTERGATEEERVIVARAPRVTEIRRRRSEEDRTGHVIAANVDRMAITASLREPPLRTGALDRYLVLASVLNVEPLIVITKTDQAHEEDPGWETLEPYRALGIPVLATSAENGHGLEELREILRGSVTVFAGHSGVGKSSLCLALGILDAPEAGELSYAHGRVRGRHTTSVARLLELPGGGGWVVDTPGVRAIGLVDLRPEDARVHFTEFADFAGDCEFASCLHVAEEDCGVRAAVDAGQVPVARYEGYLRLMTTLEEGL